jgi:BirA family biotin operon repressor/biotin-[acetyl-CoA-carboxylase] ligase
MNLQQLQDQLSGLPIPQIRYFESIGSSNDEALAWVSSGADDGCLVVADLQTSGRGRFGRKWVTRPGVSLAFSLIVRPTAAETAYLGFFSPLGALAISQALEGALGLSAQIKWPNDVLLNGRKAAGILVEAGWLGETLEGVVIGIGMNITPEAVPPDAEVLFPATSVEDAAGHPVNRLDLLRAVLSGIFAWRAQIGSPEFQQAWEDRLAFRDKWVVVSEATPGSTPINGQVVGLAPDGGLVLRDRRGETRTIAVGDVHLRPQGE